MNRMLSALGATFAVILLTLSSASANPYYYSQLICLPEFEDSGTVMIKKPSGDLAGFLRTDGPPIFGEEFSCEITCDNNPPLPRLVLGFEQDCGRTGDTTGYDTFGVPGLGAVGPGKAALFCKSPVVRVFNHTIDCRSGYPTPQ